MVGIWRLLTKFLILIDLGSLNMTRKLYEEFSLPTLWDWVKEFIFLPSRFQQLCQVFLCNSSVFSLSRAKYPHTPSTAEPHNLVGGPLKTLLMLPIVKNPCHKPTTFSFAQICAIQALSLLIQELSLAVAKNLLLPFWGKNRRVVHPHMQRWDDQGLYSTSQPSWWITDVTEFLWPCVAAESLRQKSSHIKCPPPPVLGSSFCF